MKINDFTTGIGKLIKKDNQQVNKTAALSKSDELHKSDSLAISSQAKKVEQYVAKAMQPVENKEKVQAIKDSIAKGTYKLDSTELAKKMLEKE